MSLNPLYVPLYNLQQYFVDRDSGLPLAGGKVYFYSDVNRTTLKNVYELQGNAANYTFSPLPNPVILSGVGTPVDNSGNDIVIYAYPYDAELNSELYYVVVQDSMGVPQLTRQAVPGVEGAIPSSSNNLFNYIPNGQFLAHTNLPNNELEPGSNIIAQGGFRVVLDPAATSTNTWEYSIQPPTMNPNQSPRYIGTLICTAPVGTESIKAIRIQFPDVNKFSTNTSNIYTFAFWSNTPTAIPASINVVKYFGTNGSPQETITQEVTTLPASPEFLANQFEINFGTDTGYTVDLVNNNDFVAIDISLPTNVALDLSVTNFVLVEGQVSLTGFPVQTNADMLTRGIAGWMPTPDPDGFDLYCAPVLTRNGMIFDRSQIGMIEASLSVVPSPSSSSSTTNLMNCEGSSFINSEYSYLGIPYARLGEYLTSVSPIANTPMYGTGSNYAIAYTEAGSDTLLRLTVNSSGTGIAGAIDGNTGWSIGSIVTYGTSTTGSASINYTAYSSAANTDLCVGNFASPNSAAGNGTSGFTVTVLDNYIGLLAEQGKYAFTVSTVAASALANPSSTGKYWFFSNASTDYYMWFQITNESDPVVGSRTGIKINLDASCTAQDVANVVREAMCAFQISTISISTKPTAGQYWEFFTNPASIQDFYVWYTVNGIGTDPKVAGSIGIKVDTVTADTTATVLTKTLTAINAYQYAVPNFQGMFLRGYDPTGIWDVDNLRRFSIVTGLSGAHIGTFEFQQLLQHNHTDWRTPAGSNGLSEVSAALGGGNSLQSPYYNVADIGQTGGGETRPVNTYVNWVIRY